MYAHLRKWLGWRELPRHGFDRLKEGMTCGAGRNNRGPWHERILHRGSIAARLPCDVDVAAEVELNGDGGVLHLEQVPAIVSGDPQARAIGTIFDGDIVHAGVSGK